MNKRVVIHIDDIGSSTATNRAAFDLIQNKYASSWSVMVPCNWFTEIVKNIKEINNIDLGIHLTLTSEWENENLKRKPTLPAQEVSSLIDNRWYFLPTVEYVLYKAELGEVRKELINQIEIAQKSWLSISHMDSHMWVLLHSRLFPIYKELVEIFKIQPFIANPGKWDVIGTWFYWCEDHIDKLTKLWFKVFDHFDPNSLCEDSSLSIENRIKAIKEWTTYFLSHVLPRDLKEEDKTPDYMFRQKEYESLKSKSIKQLLKDNNIDIINMKDI